MPDEKTGERRHRHGRRRHKRRRSIELTPKSKFIIAIFSVVFIVLVAGLISGGSHAINEIKKASEEAEIQKYVGVATRTLLLMNPSDQDWGNTTVTINDSYVAHVPELPQGMQFEIFLKDFRGTNGFFDPKTNKVQSVLVEPKGLKPLLWTPRRF